MPSAQRGGRRPGAGRPRSYSEPLLRKTVTLPPSYIEALTGFGHGNLSDGIRLLVESAHTPTGQLWLGLRSSVSPPPLPTPSTD